MSKSRNRSFQSSGAGKGSADRTTDDAAYRRNFDLIDWGRGSAEERAFQASVNAIGPWDGPEPELSGRGAYPLGYATWEGYYAARDKK